MMGSVGAFSTGSWYNGFGAARSDCLWAKEDGSFVLRVSETLSHVMFLTITFLALTALSMNFVTVPAWIFSMSTPCIGSRASPFRSEMHPAGSQPELLM